MCYSLLSATSAGPGAIFNATARSRHYVEDVVRRPTAKVVEQGRPSALPTLEQWLLGVQAVEVVTQRGLGSARRRKPP